MSMQRAVLLALLCTASLVSASSPFQSKEDLLARRNGARNLQGWADSTGATACHHPSLQAAAPLRSAVG